MQFGDARDDRQAQSATFDLLSGQTMQTPQGICTFAGRNARPAIGDNQ